MKNVKIQFMYNVVCINNMGLEKGMVKGSKRSYHVFFPVDHLRVSVWPD